MGLGNKRGHVHGSKVSGGHTTLIDGADAVVKKLGGLAWFESVRTGVISVAKGGHRSVTIRRYADGTHANTVKLILRTKRSVQDVYLRVHDMETNLPAVVGDIVRVVGKEWRGAVVYDRTADAADGVRGEGPPPVAEAERVPEQRSKKKKDRR